MPRHTTRWITALSTVAALALVASGCAAQGGNDDADDAAKTTLSLGFNPGPYFEMFTKGIQPILEKEGYTVNTKDFTDGIIVNVAVNTGEIDANIMQHEVYMKTINTQEGLSNEMLVHIPTPPMGVFGGKIKSLEGVKEGSTVAVPNDPSNLYRALKVVEGLGWLTLSDTIEPATASVQDIASNPKKLNIVPVESPQQIPSLQDVDFSVIQGNFIVSGGLKLADALVLEELSDDFSVGVVIKGSNASSDWAEDLKDAYESDEFAQYIESNDIYDGYKLPAELTD